MNRQTPGTRSQLIPDPSSIADRKWYKSLLAIMGVAFLLVGACLAVRHEPSGAVATYGVGFLLILIALMSRFRRFKGLGFEAELWEETQEEAANLIHQFKILTALIGRQLLLLSVMQGRLDGPTRKSIFDLMAQIEGIMQAAGLEGHEIESAKEPIFRYTAIDMASPIVDSINERLMARMKEYDDALKARFGSPVTDLVGYNEAMALRVQKFARVEWQHLIDVCVHM